MFVIELLVVMDDFKRWACLRHIDILILSSSQLMDRVPSRP